MVNHKFLRIVGAIAVISGVSCLWATSDRPETRYHSEPCFAQAIYKDQGPVAVAAFGSSRMAHGFDALRFAQQSKPTGQILNLSREFRGLGHVYITLRDLTEQREVHHVLLEYDPTARTAANPILPELGRWQDLWWETMHATDHSLSARIQDRARFSILRLSGPVTASLTTPPEDAGASSGNTARDCVQHRDRTDPAQLRAMRGQAFQPAQTLTETGYPPVARDAWWLTKIVELTQREGITLTLLHLPELEQQPLSTQWRKRSETLTDAKWLTPRGRLLSDLRREGHANSRHLNKKGRAALTDWLARQL